MARIYISHQQKQELKMLTAPQLLLVKAAIEADGTLNSKPQTADGAFAIAELLNATASPEYIVWKTAVSVDAIMRDGMDWARVDNLSVGKARIWDWLGRLGTFDASKPNVRAGIDAAWVGTAADLVVRASIYTHCKRSATRAEQIMATGSGTTESPSTMGYEGNITYQDVLQARAS
jgi:hypothetical protein